VSADVANKRPKSLEVLS